MIFVCALTLVMEMLGVEFLMAYMMCAIRSLSEWLFWEEDVGYGFVGGRYCKGCR